MPNKSELHFAVWGIGWLQLFVNSQKLSPEKLEPVPNAALGNAPHGRRTFISLGQELVKFLFCSLLKKMSSAQIDG